MQAYLVGLLGHDKEEQMKGALYYGKVKLDSKEPCIASEWQASMYSFIGIIASLNLSFASFVCFPDWILTYCKCQYTLTYG